MNCDNWQHCEMDFQFLNFCCELVSCWTKGLVIVCCGICDVVLWTSDWSVLVTTLYWTLLLDKSALKTITSPSHRAIVSADSTAHRSIRFVHYHPNTNLYFVSDIAVLCSKGTLPASQPDSTDSNSFIDTTAAVIYVMFTLDTALKISCRQHLSPLQPASRPAS